MNLTLGSGDISALMSGINTKAYKDLLRKFIDEDKPYYNALASPIDALRTGEILQSNYLLTLSDDYFIQYKATSKEMDVFTSSIDFAKINNGEIVDFDELKTIHLTDFIDIVQPIAESNYYLDTIKSKFKKYYYQVQCQLYCAELDSANLVFLSVDSYDDEINIQREIRPNETAKFRITRNQKVITEIKDKAKIFQQIRDHFYQEIKDFYK